MPTLKEDRQERFAQLIAERQVTNDKKGDLTERKTDRECAIEAGYSPKTASQIASRLLSDVKFKHVQDRIDELSEKHLKNAGIKVVDEVKDIKDRLTAIMDNSEERTNNKLKAIEIYCRLIGAFTEKREISGRDGGAITFRWDDG